MIRELKLAELDDLLICVSSDGCVWTTHKHKIRKNGRLDNRSGKLIKPTIDKYGYYRVTFSNNNKRKSYYVHRLIARAFLPNYSENLQVNHKNGIKLDNNLKNIEMVTLKENIRHSIETNLKPKLKRDEHGRFCGKEVM